MSTLGLPLALAIGYTITSLGALWIVGMMVAMSVKHFKDTERDMGPLLFAVATVC